MFIFLDLYATIYYKIKNYCYSCGRTVIVQKRHLKNHWPSYRYLSLLPWQSLRSHVVHFLFDDNVRIRLLQCATSTSATPPGWRRRPWKSPWTWSRNTSARWSAVTPGTARTFDVPRSATCRYRFSGYPSHARFVCLTFSPLSRTVRAVAN